MMGAAAMLTATALAKNPVVGGKEMFPEKNIVQNAVNSADHTTLVAAVKAAGLVDTLQGPGPFTVFAPVNAAFEKLPAGTVDTLLKPENKDALVKVLALTRVLLCPGCDRGRTRRNAGEGFCRGAALRCPRSRGSQAEFVRQAVS